MILTFGQALRTLREAVGVSAPDLARAAAYSQSHLRNIENGNRDLTVEFARACDNALGVGGLLLDLAFAEREKDDVKRRAVLRALGLAAASGIATNDVAFEATRVLQALNVVITESVNSASVAADTLDELVHHYSRTVSVLPPTRLYDDLLGVRAYAGTLLTRTPHSMRRYADMVVSAGWLSNLLAVVTSYMGDHPAATVWCSDAERRSRDAGHPELAGWAVLTRATIAYYQGDASRSALFAERGRSLVSIGSVAHAKLAAQEMRAQAMLGDMGAMTAAKNQAVKAIAMLPSSAPTRGVFSIALADDPPYTATSLLLVKRFQEAASMTGRVIETVYHADEGRIAEQPSNYARSLLILGLAQAGLGRINEAALVGQAALGSGGLVWPTLVLARKLDQAMTSHIKKLSAAAEYHACYVAAARPEVPSALDTTEDG